MKKDRNLFSEGKLKKRYKMYKAGKNWVVAPLVFFALGAFSIGVSPVKADQVNENSQPEDESIYTASVPTNEEKVDLGPTSKASQADAPVAKSTKTPESMAATFENSTDTAKASQASEDPKTAGLDQAQTSQASTEATNSESLATPVGSTSDLKTSTAQDEPLSSSAKEQESSAETKTSDSVALADLAKAKSNTTEEATNGATANVTTAQGFYDALNSNVKTINILDDIDYGAKYTGARPQQRINSIRDLTINGNGHQIDFGTVNIGFYATKNQSMNLILNDLTMYAKWGFGAISINPSFAAGATTLAPGVKQTIKYNNVHYYGSQTVMTKSATVILAGDSTFESTSSYTSKFRKDFATEAAQQNFELSALEIEPNAHITLTTDRGGNVYLNANGDPHFTVGKNAVLNIIQTNAGSTTRAEKSSALIYTHGAVTFDEGSIVNIDIKNADRYRDNTGSIIYIDNGSLTLNKNAMVTIGKNSSGNLNMPIVYMYGNSSKLTVNDGAKFGICNTEGLKATSDIYMYNGGTIRVNGQGATLDVSNKGDMSNGNIYIGGKGQIFVNDGGALDVSNQTTSADTLIATNGSATLSFGKGSNVDLEGSGTGKTTLITAASGSKISIYRPENVIFNNTNAATGSKLFNFAGDLNAQYVDIATDPHKAAIGPFKTATYVLDNNGASSSAKANVIGLNDTATQAGKKIADRLGTSNFLQYTAKDLQNEITIAEELNSTTTTISGTTTPDAYVTLKYYEDGKLVPISGVSYPLTAPAETTPDYLIKADSTGKWTVTLPSALSANKILVAASNNNFTPAYATAFVNDNKADISHLATETTAIASVANSVASQAGIQSQAAVSLDRSNTAIQSSAKTIAQEVASYSQSSGSDLSAGSVAASAALGALNSSMAASNANATNDTSTASEQNSAQASYALLASEKATTALKNSSLAQILATDLTAQVKALNSKAQILVDNAAKAQQSTLTSLATQAASATDVAKKATASYASASETVNSVAAELNSIADFLQQATGDDPVITAGKANAPVYASEAEKLEDSLKNIGSLATLKTPTAEELATASVAATNNAAALKEALNYYATGDVTEATKSLDKATATGTATKFTDLTKKGNDILATTGAIKAKLNE
ncbi:MAG: KxYKxGKxW signal peptide domain-containing protein, partial [Ligilactobacillus sp.]|nr:KxYKxGKxW signal peptide domain-containing protein [Ligilactobacillus sp.]